MTDSNEQTELEATDAAGDRAEVALLCANAFDKEVKDLIDIAVIFRDLVAMEFGDNDHYDGKLTDALNSLGYDVVEYKDSGSVIRKRKTT